MVYHPAVRTMTDNLYLSLIHPKMNENMIVYVYDAQYDCVHSIAVGIVHWFSDTIRTNCNGILQALANKKFSSAACFYFPLLIFHSKTTWGSSSQESHTIASTICFRAFGPTEPERWASPNTFLVPSDFTIGYYPLPVYDQAPLTINHHQSRPLWSIPYPSWSTIIANIWSCGHRTINGFRSKM